MRPPVSDRRAHRRAPPLPLGGDRPSQTARRRVPAPASRRAVRHATLQGRYFVGALRPGWRPGLIGFPPILHMDRRASGKAAVKVHGVFPSDRGYPAPRGIHFAEPASETAGEVVTPFVQVGTYPTRNFATCRTVIVTAAVYRGCSGLAPLPLTFRHRAGVRPLYVVSSTSQSPVFLVNSRHPRPCVPRPGCLGARPASPEVTRAICRVPSTPFARPPGYARPVHLCRFRVCSSMSGASSGA